MPDIRGVIANIRTVKNGNGESVGAIAEGCIEQGSDQIGKGSAEGPPAALCAPSPCPWAPVPDRQRCREGMKMDESGWQQIQDRRV